MSDSSELDDPKDEDFVPETEDEYVAVRPMDSL